MPSSKEQSHYHITSALIRQEGQVLLVQQRDRLEGALFWMLPGGRVRQSEFLVEGLVREIQEETGLQILDVGPLAYVARLNNPQLGFQTTTRVFEVNTWRGALNANQLGARITAAEFLPETEAITRLRLLPDAAVRDPLLAYLQGTSLPGTIWLYRQHGSGTPQLITCLSSHSD